MAKRIRRLGLLLAALAMLLVVSGCGKSVADSDALARAKRTDKIVWGVKADTRLFGLMNTKTGQIQGFEVDMAKALTKQILGKSGKAELTQVTSDTRVPMLKAGNVDAVIGTMSITPERQKQLNFSHSYFSAGQSLLVPKGSKIKSVKDLKKGTTVIGVQGSNSVDNVKKAAPDARVLQLTDYSQAFTALKSHQGAALTTDNGILYGMSQQDPNYVVVGGTFTKEPYGIAMNKGQTNMTRAMNKALATLQKNGTYERLLKKWFSDVPGFDIKEVQP
ncbi:transporter substrate-binding domain-containing protein [Lacticaseibacillus camelliae]|uniref:Glutamine ABC superfamily ATP binding cassette transporter, substrate binding protein n=1 Tax=Lacticaseibacillus camelliae DSM 22697 = JCM 13995 TaxID=1423730 RepID=A0A0R2F405_9LACO|nr:transporter substrate-binding domain-containing protein [Lacticaseibacillus camelliae]KRN23289.1 glutamine ABC superfamily ATP binding cassette transporter, substrate binding protein [Lacticaseibacillus camelliae DSM 22697 = JCM 13995]